MEVLSWIQNSAFSTWSRESNWALFTYLIVHTISMGFIVGTGLLVDARVLGLANRAPLSAFSRLLSFMAFALVIAACSGVLLLISYPAKHLTNPVFYIKLSLLLVALLITRELGRRLMAGPAYDKGPAPTWARIAAAISIPLWMLGLTAGKFLEYTNHILLAP